MDTIVKTALVLVGHGSAGYEDFSYVRFRDELRASCPETYLVMLYGEPSVSSLLPVLCEKKISRVCLFPLFLSPASHVTRDIAAENATLRSTFAAAGIQTEMLGHGLLESSEMRAAIGALCLKRMEQVFQAESDRKADIP